MRAPEQTIRPRVNCPAGAHLARCVQVIDLGDQHYKPGEAASRKLYIAFETCEARHTFKDEKGPEPFMLQIEFAWYMASAGPKKTKLRTFIESWRGKSFASDEEAKAYDFEKLLGGAAILMVAHKPKTDGTMKAEIVGIAPADRQAPPAVNPAFCYEIDMGEGGTFGKLPPFLQKKVRESDQFNGGAVQRINQGPDDAAAQQAEGEPDWGID